MHTFGLHTVSMAVIVSATLLLIELPSPAVGFSASKLPGVLPSTATPALRKHPHQAFRRTNIATGSLHLQAMAGLKANWEELKDEASGNVYYWNSVSGETTWERPSADGAAPAAAAPAGGLRGPFGPEDAFELPDGTKYQPGDAATDSIYGAALEAPVEVDDAQKAKLAAGLLGFSILVPTLLVSLLGGS